MLYVVKIIYTVSPDEVSPHIAAHKGWLMKYARCGLILVAGPLEDAGGGLLLAHCPSREDLESLMALDPYIQNQVSTYEVTAFTAALHARDFPAQWTSPNAKSA